MLLAKKVKISFPLVLLLFSISFSSFSQQKSALPCLEKKFSIIAHIVVDSLGSPNIGDTTIIEGIDTLNRIFSKICVSFEVCEFRYIDNFQYDTLVNNSESQETNVKYHERFRINMFFFNTYKDEPDVCGRATVGGIGQLDNGDVYILKKCAIPPDLTIAHEMGHFFGLVHTFEENGDELVDGSNCETVGDKICDTPADPFVFGDDARNYVNNRCEFVNTAKKDANNEFYDPDVKNIMSYYPCACRFTHGQYLKMAETYLSSNPKSW